MFDLSQHIEYLLLTTDCVVVPGLGAFLINDEEARYDTSSGRYMPPKRSIAFNPSVAIHDGILAESVSRREGISYQQAIDSISQQISALHAQIDSENELPFGRLGTFYKGADSPLPTFSPSTDSLPMRRFEGLSPVAISAIEKGEHHEATFDAGDFRPHRFVIPTPLKVAATLIVLMVVSALLYSSSSVVGDATSNFAALDSGWRTIVQPKAPVEETVDTLPVAVPQPNIDLFIAIPPKALSEGVKMPVSLKHGYLVVVGSYNLQSQALKHIAMTGDNTLKIKHMNGYYRIYAACVSNFKDANHLAGEISARHPNAWVCQF